MPIYEFQCERCSHIWDELRKISDPLPEACPHCGQASVAQRMTAAGFRLKGAGWYETDFKKSGDTKRNLVDSESASAGAAEKAPESSSTNTSTTTNTSAAPSTDSASSGGSA
jgi:putative FmdB family regulatory protein